MAEKDFVVKNGLVVNTNLIVADGDLNRVGINNSTPDATLTITGTANVSGNVITLGTLTTANLAVGSNVNINASALFVGDSTTNSTQTSELLKISNSTSTANLTPVDLKIGISTVNSTALAVGANLSVNSSLLYVGTSTVNTVVNSSAIAITNSTSGFSVTPSSIFVGNSVVNVQILSTGITGNGISISSLNATSITNGTLPSARLSGAYTDITQVGTLLGVAVTGNSNFDSGVLFVDGTNNRVGINNTTPADVLSVAGNTYILGRAIVNGNFTVSGDVSTLSVANSSGNVQITAAGITGNGIAISSLNATSITNGTLPSARLSGAYTSITQVGTIAGIAVSGNSNFDSGVLYVDGVNNRVGINTTTPASALSVTGDAYIEGTITVTQDFVVTGSLTTSGTQQFSGNLTPESNGVGGVGIALGNTISLWNLYGNVANFNGNVTFGSNLVINTTSISYIGNTTTSPTITITNTGSISVGNSVTTQTGSIITVANSTGNVQITPAGISGNGISITSVNATSITNGTLPSARISGAYTGITQLGTLTGLAVTGNSNFDSGVLFVDGTNNRVGVNTSSPSVSLQVASNDAIIVPIGNTANRPTAANGMIRYNLDSNAFEGHSNGAWGSVSDSQGGFYKGNRGTIGNIINKQNLFRINSNTQSNNITIAAGENALAVGPITVDVGYSLVVEGGGRAVII